MIDLPISTAFHTYLFEPVARILLNRLQALDIHPTQAPVVANIDGTAKETKPEIITSLSEQVSNPVQWVRTQDFFLRNNVTDIIECGPGKTLTGLARRTVKGIALFNASDIKSIDAVAAALATE